MRDSEADPIPATKDASWECNRGTGEDLATVTRAPERPYKSPLAAARSLITATGRSVP